MDFEDVEVPVYEENATTGKRQKSKKLSYMMSHIDDRVGAKINLKDQYYDAQATMSYAEKGKRLMKYVKKDDPPEGATDEPPSKEQIAKLKKLEKEQKEIEQKEKVKLQRQMTTYSYISPLNKFETLGQFFGVNAIKLEPTAGNHKKQKKQLKALLDRGCVVENNIPKLREILKVLSKSEKRNEKETALIVPLMEEIKFFKERKPMNYEELSEVAQNLQYMFRKPGEIIFK